MSGENENISIEGQSLDVDEWKKNNILSFIQSCSSLHDTIEQLGGKKFSLVFYWSFVQERRWEYYRTGKFKVERRI